MSGSSKSDGHRWWAGVAVALGAAAAAAIAWGFSRPEPEEPEEEVLLEPLPVLAPPRGTRRG